MRARQPAHCDEDEHDDFVDLRDLGAADLLGVCPDLLREMRRRHPTLGPVVGRRQVLDLIGLFTLEQHLLEDDHER